MLRGRSYICPADLAIACHNLEHPVPFHEHCPDFLDPTLRAFEAGDRYPRNSDVYVASSLAELDEPATHSHALCRRIIYDARERHPEQQGAWTGMLEDVIRGDAEAIKKARQIVTGDTKHRVNKNDTITYYVPKDHPEVCRVA